MGGINEYGYASGNPINLDDPLGLDSGMQFPLPVGAPTDFAGGQAMFEEQSAQAQFQVAQYRAMQVELQAAQCLSRLWVANYHTDKLPGQSAYGATETLSSLRETVVHLSGEVSATYTHMYLDATSADWKAFCAEGIAATERMGSFGLKLFSRAMIVVPLGADLGSAIDATYHTIVNAGSCCSIP